MSVLRRSAVYGDVVIIGCHDSDVAAAAHAEEQAGSRGGCGASATNRKQYNCQVQILSNMYVVM